MINIDELIKTAMKAGNKVELKAYKNIKVEIQKNQTAKGAKPLTDESQIQIIAKYAKSLEDAINQFLDARREDLMREYAMEWEVVKKLLPEPVNERHLKGSLEGWCLKNGFVHSYLDKTEKNVQNGRVILCKIPKKEMGNAIKYLKSKFPAADGKMISEIVKQYLI